MVPVWVAQPGLRRQPNIEVRIENLPGRLRTSLAYPPVATSMAIRAHSKRRWGS